MTDNAAVHDLRQQADLPMVISETVFGDEPLHSEELLNLYEGTHGDVVAVWSSAGTFGYVSSACRTTLGWQPAELIDHSVTDFVHPEDQPAVLAGCRAALRSPMPSVATYRLRCKDGGYLWTETVLEQMATQRKDGEPLLMASIRDVADRKMVEVRLQRQALTDPLTGIANRTVLMDRLVQALRRLERSKTVLAIMYLDLDRFKVINDSLGHEVGDHLLTKVAERAIKSIRPTDTLARIGGDEFVVLAEGLGSLDLAKQLAERVCKDMERPFDLHGESIVCTVSAGVSTTTDFGQSPEGLLQEADLALYKAKDRGRNRAEVFDEELRTTAVGRLAIERNIRSAIDDNRLRVRYQPIVNLTSGHVIRAEALLRVSEQDGLILPKDFIDVAEETGLLVGIDEYVMAEAIGQVAEWNKQLSVADFAGVTINVTGRHLSDSRFVQLVTDTLTVHGLAPESLALEVTERVLMEASNSAMDCLRTIRETGVLVGLDDFGTGYSSLSYLRQFPLDFLKIDQSFVRQLLRKSSEDLAIITAIIELAHGLGLFVIAEGVETEQQLKTLIRLRCDHAQGFLFSRAEDPGVIATLIESRSKYSSL